MSRRPFPSPRDFPNPGIEPRSPTLQVDSLPAEAPGKPKSGEKGIANPNPPEFDGVENLSFFKTLVHASSRKPSRTCPRLRPPHPTPGSHPLGLLHLHYQAIRSFIFTHSSLSPALSGVPRTRTVFYSPAPCMVQAWSGSSRTGGECRNLSICGMLARSFSCVRRRARCLTFGKGSPWGKQCMKRGLAMRRVKWKTGA